MNPNKNFEKWALGFSGCDGGDIGTVDEKSTWVCGIEWGGGHDAGSLSNCMAEDVSTPPSGHEQWQHNLNYIFNWQAVKLLTAIEGGSVSSYKTFAQEKAPFVTGSSGYFKMNLYPIAFKNTNCENWASEFSKLTGFNNKEEYLDWCESMRLPIIRAWAAAYKPELIICLGKTYFNQYSKAFFDFDSRCSKEIINDRELIWGVNNNETLVVVLPFMVNRNGLTKNSTIQIFGERISELLKATRCKSP